MCLCLRIGELLMSLWRVILGRCCEDGNVICHVSMSVTFAIYFAMHLSQHYWKVLIVCSFCFNSLDINQY